MYRSKARAAVFLTATAFLGWSATSVLAGEPVTRLSHLSEQQYRHIVRDVFGSSIKVQGRFQPEVRQDGLLALGAGSASITASSYEQYDAIARTIAEQVIGKENRKVMVACKPADAKTSDDRCAQQFLARTGRLLFRRPLTNDELQREVAIVGSAAKTFGDFYAGLGTGLVDLLTSSNFLFIERRFVPDPKDPSRMRLDAYSTASQLSFFLWNSAPTEGLLDAAESGALYKPKELDKQAGILLASPQLEDGVRAFFSDMLGFDEFDTLSKDTTLFPKFTPLVKQQAPEQTLRTLVDLLVARDGDYRDIFTTTRTFLTAPLAAVYGVPFLDTAENGIPSTWAPHDYAQGDPRAGILGEVSFAGLHSHEARTSPTLRGKAIREYLLCQKVPAPPANVDFSAMSKDGLKTTRERLTVHATQPMCAGCHKIMDPVGLALENFDSIGSYRLTENGAAIDASGQLNGIQFTNVVELARALQDYPAATSCVARKAFAFGTGHMPASDQPEWAGVEKVFTQAGYKLRPLLRAIAESDAFVHDNSKEVASAQK